MDLLPVIPKPQPKPEPPEWAKKKKACAREMRKARKSYEDIAHELAITPWQAFAWTNPDKTPEQVSRWMEKHYPDRHVEQPAPKSVDVDIPVAFMRSVLVRDDQNTYRWHTGTDLTINENGIRLAGETGAVTVPWTSVVGFSALPLSAPVESSNPTPSKAASVVNVYTGGRKKVIFSDGRVATIAEDADED